MRNRALLSILALLFATTAFALPKIDSPKEADPLATWQTKAKFSTLHGDKASDSWSGYGSYQEARSILQYALRNAPGYSSQDKYDHFMRAARDAREASGSAEKYRRLIDVLLEGAKATSSYSDGAMALRGGCDFLVNGDAGPYMTKSILKLGVSMVQGRMSSNENAYKICMKAVSAATYEAERENQQWASILRFTKVAGNKTGTYSNGYKAMRTICNTVIDAQEGQSVFIRALTNISRAGLSGSEDLYKVMMAGFTEYQSTVPSKTHKVLARFVLTAANKAKTYSAGRKIMVAAAEKMQNLGFDAPAAKVLLQAGRDLASDYSIGTTEDRYNVALAAMRACSEQNIPGHIARALQRGIRDTTASSSYSEGLRIAISCIENLL